MEHAQKVVMRLPILEGSLDAEALEANRIGPIGGARVKKLLREESPWFIVADVGLSLRWIRPAERFGFWKEEVQMRLVKPGDERFQLEDYPGGYCYVASEWRHRSEGHVNIVLEKHH